MIVARHFVKTCGRAIESIVSQKALETNHMSASLAVGTPRYIFNTSGKEIVSICSSVGFGVLLPAPKRFTYVGEHLHAFKILDASHLCTVCARAIGLVLFVCPCIATFFDTCHAHNTPRVWMELTCA